MVDLISNRTTEITKLALDGLMMRQKAITANTANVMTPDYQRKEVNFEGQLNDIIEKDDLKTKSNWSDSDDLAMMFRNTFKPAYYKKLHHLIHRIYRRSKAINSIKKVIVDPLSVSPAIFRTGLTYFYYSAQIFVDTISLRRIESHE